MVVMLMLLCCRYKPFTLPVIGYIGRTHSANIYYFHILILIYANRLVPEWSAWQAVLVFAGTLPISWLFNTVTDGFRKATHRIKACQEARSGV